MELCAELAHAAEFPYFSLQAGRECWAGLDYARATRQVALPVEACNVPCSGAPSTSCGGVYANAIYAFTPPATASAPPEQGNDAAVGKPSLLSFSYVAAPCFSSDAWLSSTAYGGEAHMAIDGDFNTEWGFEGKLCAHSGSPDPAPYWAQDFFTPINVTAVDVYTRSGFEGRELHYLDSIGHRSDSMIHHHAGGSHHGHHAIPCRPHCGP